MRSIRRTAAEAGTISSILPAWILWVKAIRRRNMPFRRRTMADFSPGSLISGIRTGRKTGSLISVSLKIILPFLMGYYPEACDQRGECGIQYVVEADGSAYPCDFICWMNIVWGTLMKIPWKRWISGVRRLAL